MYGNQSRLVCGVVSLEKNITISLGQGRIGKLVRLGSVQVGVSSKGLSSAEEVTLQAIIKSRINFRPSKRVHSFVKDIAFQKKC